MTSKQASKGWKFETSDEEGYPAIYMNLTKCAGEKSGYTQRIHYMESIESGWQSPIIQYDDAMRYVSETNHESSLGDVCFSIGADLSAVEFALKAHAELARELPERSKNAELRKVEKIKREAGLIAKKQPKKKASEIEDEMTDLFGDLS